MSPAREEYEQRLAAHRATAEGLARRERRISNLRLLVFAAGLVLAWFTFGARSLGPVWLGMAAVAFVGLVILHDRVIQRRDRADRAVTWYERGIERIEDRWAGHGETGERFDDAGHAYAGDMDLFGRGSLYELLCTARSPAGQEALARWLLAPAEEEVVRSRQVAVEELRPAVDLREDLALLGESVRASFAPEVLVAWGEERHAPVPPVTRVVGAGLVGLSLIALWAWFALGLGAIPFLVALALQGGFAWSLRGRVKPILRGAERAGRDLLLLQELFERLEAERFRAPALVELRRALDTEGLPPSRRIAGLARLTNLLDARRNQLFAPIAALLLWGTQLALALERWRALCGPHLREWIAAAGELEALCALSAYAYERPEDPFPELTSEGAVFEGEGLGHPLLPGATCVRNDVALGGERRVLMVSGSNMSGKSTLLRTVGTNAILALAGAPVRARRLRVSPLSVAASLRVIDSLQEGTSHFYAEIKRLRQIVDLTAGERPVLFLLDEILHGTNSHDRRIGAEAIVRGLLERGAIGLVTTHDLALARIADDRAPAVENVHFQDELVDGRMRFDYRLRPGVVEKSNALDLMRSVGLDV